MFEQTFVDGKEPARKSALALSLVLQSSFLGLLTLASIIYTQGLPQTQLKALVVVPQPPTATTVRLGERKRTAAICLSVHCARRWPPLSCTT